QPGTAIVKKNHLKMTRHESQELLSPQKTTTAIPHDEQPGFSRSPGVVMEVYMINVHYRHRLSFSIGKYLCISSLVLSPNIFAEYKSFYVRKLMVEYLLCA